MKSLFYRVLLAVPFVVLFSYSVLGSSHVAKYLFVGLFVLLLVVSSFELSYLIGTSFWVVLLGMASGVIVFLNFFPGIAKLYFHFSIPSEALLIILLVLTVIPAFFLSSPYAVVSSFSGFATSFFYLGIFPSFLLVMKHASPAYLLVVAFTVWIGDSAAYFLGSKYGVRKLIPHISPNKTWVGFWANLFFSVLFFVLAFYFFVNKKVPLSQTVLVAILISLVAQLGDIIESSFKRVAGRKDSGFLPGHGGVLDALDALFFVAPVAYMVASLLGA